ncbi:T9SS type A sorting domain-containing protein [Fluviicola sp.]|uniref:T9SS type A sorting domain-containing protein n=1 Tax=Fluviicola sp. TaxID=1917219 RepID=UPI0031E1C4B8
MKHLYSLVFVFVTWTSLSLSMAQTIIPTNASAPGVCDGSVTFADAASYSTCTWTWYQDTATVVGTNVQTVSNLCAGNYIFVIDSAGVSMTAIFTIGDPCSNLVLSASTLTNCTPGNCDGAVQLTVTGGSGPYVFSASGAGTQPQALFSGLCPGAYMFSVMDVNGCSTTATAVVVDPSMNPIVPSLTVTNDSTGTCSGSASVSPTGGTAPYTITWSNGAIGNSVYNLCAGNYSVAIWDSNGDSSVSSFTINSPCNNIALTASVTNCTPGNCDGAIQANATGGTAPYTFSVSGAPQSPVSFIANLCPGTYSIICMDAVGCSTAPLTVTVADTSLNSCSGFTGNFTSSTAINGTCTGTISGTVSGGTPSYIYAVDGGLTFGTANTFSGLCPGSYTVVALDANGCTFSQLVTVGDSMITINLAANLTSTDDLTNNCSGSASVSPSGGIAPYAIAWSNGVMGNTVSNLCAGIYSVTVWDQGNDSTTVNFVIADSASTYTNNPYPNGAINDTLYTDLVSNCVIDYNAIDSAALYQAVYSSSNQSLYVTWAVYSPTDTVYISDTLALIGNPGYYNLTISVYCPNKSGNDFFKIEQVIYFDGTTVYFSTLGVDEHLLEQVSVYPNPFNHSISINNKEGVVRSLKLVDLNGRILSEMKQVNSGLVEMDQLEKISSGTYLLILSGSTGSKTYQVIK